MVTLEKKYIEKIADGWSRRGPPFRPGEETLDLLARETNGIGCGRILILGATPELVDFSLRKKAGRITLMDWSEGMVKAMESLGSEDWTGVEKIIADWRKPRKDLRNTFNTILGDGSLNMISFPKDWETVLGNLASYLIPGGRIILRNIFYPIIPFSFSIFLEEAIRHFRKMNRNRESLKGLVSEIRMGAFIGSITSRNFVLQELRHNLEKEAHEKLKLLATLPKELDIIEYLFGAEKEGKNRQGSFVPSKEDVMKLFHASGFTVRSFQPVENRFGLNVSFVLTAVKA